MARKKILWLCSWYPGMTEPFNGDFIQRHARAAALYNDIHVIHVIGDSTGRVTTITKEMHREEGLTEQLVYYPRTTSFWGKITSNYRWYFLLKQAIRKYLVEQKKPDLTHVHIPYKAAMAGNWLRKKYKVPYVLTEHWGIYNDVEKLNYVGRSSFFKRFMHTAFTEAKACISVSEYLAAGVRKLVAPVEFSIIPNATDTRLFYYKEKKEGRFLFIHVSNMVPLKNAEGILRAFKLLLQKGIEASLLMVGNPDYTLPQFAESMGFTPEQVRFTGEIPYADVASHMQAADCLLVYSNIENSPCVIGEALCCGLPVIATEVGGIPELVDQSNALLTPPGDDAALAANMQVMLLNNKRYDRPGIATKAAQQFSYEVVGKLFDDIYEKAVN
ncbi:MAG: glycosyltransferase [Bacteroidetes bacterium]|nr:glycosyltransferase [Bacteroidota bacterium]